MAFSKPIQIGKVLLIVVAFTLSITNAEYVIPEVTFQALKSGGFRVFIPDLPGTKIFRFSGNVNEDVSPAVPGKLSADTDSPINGKFLLSFNNTLKATDVVNYGVFVYYGRLGYRKDNLSWRVAESDLLNQYPDIGPSCRPGITTMDGGKPTCRDGSIINEEFNTMAIDTVKWLVDHRLPFQDVNEEFNSYENSDDTRFIKDNILYLKPVLRNEVRGILNLRSGCTARDDSQCYFQQRGSFLLPPVRSAKLVSKIPFKYGKIDIRAKLPAGDWIIPVIELTPADHKPNDFATKIFIAYSRGNEKLVSSYSAADCGAHEFSAGPILQPNEPERSQKLLKTTSNVKFNQDFHVYSLEWLPDKLTFYIDNKVLGQVVTGGGFPEFGFSAGTPFNNEYLVSLGVAIGGLNDFPDDTISTNNNPKPWKNTDPLYVKQFYDAKDQWLNTWRGDDAALKVDYVKVHAV